MNLSSRTFKEKNLENFKEVIKDNKVIAFVPLFDICNYSFGVKGAINYNDYTYQNIHSQLSLQINKQFKVGENYSYSYLDQDNFKLFLTYGFYIKDNTKDNIKFSIGVDKKYFSSHKLNYCKYNGYFEGNEIAKQIKDETTNILKLSFTYYKGQSNIRNLNIIRLYYFGEPYDEEVLLEALDRIDENKWLNYYTEMTSRLFIFAYLRSNSNIGGFTIPIITSILQTTKNYYIDNEKSLSDEIKFKNKLREPIFRILLNKMILSFNIMLKTQIETIEILKDQMKKIKDHYLNLV